MRYFYDCEFIEDGTTIDLISIGIVAEDGREYYAIASDAPWDRIEAHDWLVRNVVPHLPVRNRDSLDRYLAHPESLHPKPAAMWEIDVTDTRVKPRWVIANEVRDFLFARYTASGAELWADYSAYDHVVLCQLWGTMMDLPQGVPMWTNDLQQLWRASGRPELPEQTSGQHDALADARHLRGCWLACQN